MKRVNNMFYTETVEDQFIFDKTGLPCDVSTMANNLNAVIDHIILKGAEWEEAGVSNIFATLAPNKEGYIVCSMSGSKEWTKEQIKQYESAIQEEKNDMSVLQELINKYPNKSFALFSKMMEEKLEERVNE